MRRQQQPRSSKRPGAIRFGNASPDARRWSAVLALVAVFAAAVVILDAPSPFRPVAVLFFLGCGPGLSLIGLIGIKDVTHRLVLGIGVSLALDTIIATVGVYAGYWSPPGILMVLVAITLAGAGLQLLVAPDQGSATTTPSITCDAKRGRMDREMIPTEAVRNAPLVSFIAKGVTVAAIDSVPTKPNLTSVSVNRAAHRDPGSLAPSARLTRTVLIFSFIGGCFMLIALGARRTIQM